MCKDMYTVYLYLAVHKHTHAGTHSYILICWYTPPWLYKYSPATDRDHLDFFIACKSPCNDVKCRFYEFGMTHICSHVNKKRSWWILSQILKGLIKKSIRSLICLNGVFFPSSSFYKNTNCFSHSAEYVEHGWAILQFVTP